MRLLATVVQEPWIAPTICGVIPVEPSDRQAHRGTLIHTPPTYDDSSRARSSALQLAVAAAMASRPEERRRLRLRLPRQPRRHPRLTPLAISPSASKRRTATRYDAMQRKARAGHVCGGRVFGYDNVEVTGPGGQRSHVERRINDAEAAVVRRIFELCAGGAGLTRITKQLNAEGVPSPRSQQGRPRAWVASSVREVLLRPLYRGEVQWNRTRKRDAWGRARRSDRPEAEWLRTAVPELRIVSDELWTAAQQARELREGRFSRGERGERPSPYLLSGFARCAVCGGGFASHSRTHGSHRVLFYACTTHWKRGATVCTNGLVGRMDAIDAEVLATLQDDVLRPAVVERTIAMVLEELSPKRDDEPATIWRENWPRWNKNANGWRMPS